MSLQQGWSLPVTLNPAGKALCWVVAVSTGPAVPPGCTGAVSGEEFQVLEGFWLSLAGWVKEVCGAAVYDSACHELGGCRGVILCQAQLSSWFVQVWSHSCISSCWRKRLWVGAPGGYSEWVPWVGALGGCSLSPLPAQPQPVIPAGPLHLGVFDAQPGLPACPQPREVLGRFHPHGSRSPGCGCF